MKERKHFGAGYRVVTLGIVLAAGGALWLSLTLLRQIQVNEATLAQQSVTISGAAITDPDIAEHYADSSSVHASARTTTKKVLFLSSYDPTAVCYEDQISGMLSVSDSNEIEFDVINMDFFKHKQKEDLDEIARTVENRVKEEEYYGVITADDEALAFVMDHRNDYFAGLPVIFYGVEDKAAGELAAKDPNTAGYLEDTNVRDTVDLALSLFPDTKEVAAVYDNSLTGQAEGKDFAALREDSRYQGITFTPLFFGDYTDEELQKTVASYGEGTVILVLSAHTDADNNYYTTVEVTRMVSQASSVPVFRNAKGGYNNGAVAGKITSFENVAADAVRTMHRVLDEGLDLSTVSVLETPECGEYVASYENMKKFGAPMSSLPKDTVVVGAPVTLQSQYGPLLLPSVLIVGGLLLIVLGSQMEIRKRRRAEKALQATAEELRTAGEHDFLTGTLTRQEAQKRLRKDSERAQPYALVLADIDGFKEINETYGHAEGDRLLREIAAELMTVTKKHGGEIARYGGDEFLIWIPERQLEEKDAILTDVLSVFRTCRSAGLNRGRILASIGAANSGEGETPHDVLQCAEAAVAKVKETGKNGCLLFTQDMKREEMLAEKKREMVLDAIQNDGLTMVYQPQVETATGKLVGFEALVRMKNGAMGPAEFIPIAENSGWIGQIGNMTTEMTIRQIHRWREKGLTPPPVSINYSAAQLRDAGYESYLEQLLKKYEVPASAVNLEVTESLFIQNWEEASDFFRRIREMSISLHMDDFGTGYSSLSYLARIPVDVVKIDRSLLVNYSAGKQESFLADVIGLVHDVGKRALCEGAETKSQVTLLKDLSCDFIQGYYFGKPGSAEEAEEAMRRGNLDPEQG